MVLWSTWHAAVRLMRSPSCDRQSPFEPMAQVVEQSRPMEQLVRVVGTGTALSVPDHRQKRRRQRRTKSGRMRLA